MFIMHSGLVLVIPIEKSCAPTRCCGWSLEQMIIICLEGAQSIDYDHFMPTFSKHDTLERWLNYYCIVQIEYFEWKWVGRHDDDDDERQYLKDILFSRSTCPLFLFNSSYIFLCNINTCNSNNSMFVLQKYL